MKPTDDELLALTERQRWHYQGIDLYRWHFDKPDLLALMRACIALGQEDMLDRACKAAKREA